MTKENDVSIAPVIPDLEVHANPDLHCKACNKDFKNAHAKRMHVVVVHEKRGYLATGKRKKGKTIKTSKGKLKCPHCSRTFARATGLGSHLRTHGIKGSSKSVLALKKKLGTLKKKLGRPKGSKTQSKETKLVKPAPALNVCTLCNPPKTMVNYKGLAIHQAQVHGVKGKLHHPSKFENEGTIIHANIHSTENSSSNERHTINQALVVARLTGEAFALIRLFCEGNDLPTRLIANRVATQILTETGR
jgi:hypothetical protein